MPNEQQRAALQQLIAEGNVLNEKIDNIIKEMGEE